VGLGPHADFLTFLASNSSGMYNVNDLGRDFEGDDEDLATAKIAFTWLLRLRWWAICCQIAIVLAVLFLFHIRISLPLFSVFLLFQAVSNLYFQYLIKRRERIPSWLIGGVMVWDIIYLTILLYSSGGPMNPFTFLYLVHVALAAVLMQQRWSWSLTVLTIGCYAALFFLQGHNSLVNDGPVMQPACLELAGGMSSESVHMHLQGMWVAFSLTALFIAFFVGKIQQALSGHHQTISRLRREKVKTERLASLATLAAGAAHELSTPLSTIAVAANEMQYVLREGCDQAELSEDLRLIRGQVQRCREILSQLSADAGQQAGEPMEPISAMEFIETLAYEFERETGRKVDTTVLCPEVLLAIPVDSFLRTLLGLLNNAAQADPDGRVRLRCTVEKEKNLLKIEVSDQGVGMDEQTLLRAGEPFFTTKTDGKGMGLGLFLARSVAENYGGGLELHSLPNEGTTVTFAVSLNAVKLDRKKEKIDAKG